MIRGIHAILYAQKADATRRFFEEVLGMPSVDAGGGWSIFALPPAELGVHPTDDEGGACELYLMCDDLPRTMAELTRKGVRFVGVSFKHRDGRPLLAEADLAIEPGRITALIGPSGVGKTTTLDLILGLLPPKEGAVILGGVDFNEVDLLKWRQMLGYVPQDVTLFHDTIRNNIALGEDTYTDDEVWRALRAAGADDFIEALPLGLNHVVGERGLMISGGQRQRIAVARALLHRPAILILDEATAGLDRETEAGICGRIRQMVEQEGLTVISVSHGEAWRSIADRVYKLGDGKMTILEPGAGAEVVPLGKPGPAMSA